MTTFEEFNRLKTVEHGMSAELNLTRRHFLRSAGLGTVLLGGSASRPALGPQHGPEGGVDLYLATRLLPEPQGVEIRIFHHEAQANRPFRQPVQPHGIRDGGPGTSPLDWCLDPVPEEDGRFLQLKPGYRLSVLVLDFDPYASGSRGSCSFRLAPSIDSIR